MRGVRGVGAGGDAHFGERQTDVIDRIVRCGFTLLARQRRSVSLA
ncbi:hypothetical protein [Bradyrhizobium japonicum]|nr:hypothetical protein [Bradyrhizobium japonicum]